MAIRLSGVVIEVRNGTVEAPGLFRYLSFAFFFPTLLVGPISHYQSFEQSVSRPISDKTPSHLSRPLLRIVVGACKYLFLANLCNQLGYTGLVLDHHPHPKIDWLVSMVFYYLYLYCNFSGFCDIAVGSAGVLGIEMPENFDRPFVSRNIKEYWNRWHITLSQYMRDVAFTPLCKALIRLLGPASRDRAIAVAIFVVFTLTGIWHGFGLNYVVFGALHGGAIVAHHYYSGFLKRRLSRQTLLSYNKSRLVHAVCVVLTFLYVSAALSVFANTKSIGRTLSFLRIGPCAQGVGTGP
jgi:D-alanyl-lipoteichoic acid acyltransferase DltB (MBOAT superfamily)